MTGSFKLVMPIASLFVALACSNELDNDSGFAGGNSPQLTGKELAAEGGADGSATDTSEFDGKDPSGKSGDGANSGGNGGNGSNSGNKGGGSNNTSSKGKSGGGSAGSNGNGGVDMAGDEEDSGGVGLDDTGDSAEVPCKYFKRGSTARELVQGGPPVEIDVANYAQSGVGKREGSDYIFNFTVYKDGSKWIASYDRGQRGLTPYVYKGLIADSDSAGCKVSAVQQNKGSETKAGCFLASTKIRMADGKDRIIDDLKIGDMVMNPVTNSPVQIVEMVEGPEKFGMIEIGYAGSSFVVVTRQHPFLTAQGLKQAHDLTKDDSLLGADGKYHRVSHLQVRAVDAKAKAVNIKLATTSTASRDHMVLADGVVSGDLYLQETLAQEKALFTGVSTGHRILFAIAN